MQVFCAIGWVTLVVVAVPWLLHTLLVQFTWVVSHFRPDGEALSRDWLMKEFWLGGLGMDDYANGKKAWFWLEEMRVDQDRAATSHDPGKALKLAHRIRPLSRRLMWGLPIPWVILLICEAIERSWLK